MRLISQGADGPCREFNSAPRLSTTNAFSAQMVQLGFAIHISAYRSLSSRPLSFTFSQTLSLLAQSLATEQTSVGVEKYHKLICRACNPLILFNGTNKPWRIWWRTSKKKGSPPPKYMWSTGVYIPDLMIIRVKSSFWGSSEWLMSCFAHDYWILCQLHCKCESLLSFYT